MGERRVRKRRARRTPRRRFVRAGIRFGLVAVVLGPLVAIASITPIYALRTERPPTSAFMLRSRWADPASGEPCPAVAWRWVDRRAISPELRLAVVVAEDQRFLLHKGFDTRAIRRALRDRESGRVRGASSITQQVAKNLFLWPGPSWLRKGLEAWLTFWIEALWSKQRILEMYLNIAQFGPCVFGAGAASQRYFGVPASDLSTRQAALLATVLPNPKRLRAHDPGPYAQQRREEIIDLMERQRGQRHLQGL
jgi:monofunctional biosynthetic peptidoglycan transglycosylase